MSDVRPRALVHRGVHSAAGVLIDAAPGREAVARARALALWAPGVRVYAAEGALFVRFPRPALLHAATAPGHLLVEEGGLLLAAPLAPAERAALAPAPTGALVAVRGGCAVVMAVGAELDPATWLDLAPELVPVEPLGAPPEPPSRPVQPPEPELRTALGVGAAAPRAALVLERLRAAAAPPGETSLAPAVTLGGLFLTGLARVLRRVGSAIREELELVSSSFKPASARTITVRPAAPRRPGLLRRALVRLAFATRVARLAGLRQGAYLGRMLRMFERGALDEALRHAIPLGRDPTTGLPTFGTPRPRDSLAIVPQVARGGALLASGPDLFAEMQRLYRQAHQVLASQGRIDEAAFVLAELLRADEEAVSFLDRHGRLHLAAELAEARGLPVGLVVRQWFLAGDTDRAVALARAGRAFADAVDRLERGGKRSAAEALRLVWAEDLAEAGDLETAVDVVRRIEAARALSLGWIARAVAAGGAAGDALLATWLELEPARFPEIRARVLEACAQDGADGTSRRARLARGLLAAARSPASRALARPVLRGTLRDAAAGQGFAVDLRRLTSLAADGALDADLPPIAEPCAASGEAVLRLGPDDRGTRPVLDAAVLPCGRVLVALGEAGVALLARDGRVVARLDAPAHRLVVSDAGARALAIASRGEALRVSSLDLAARTARPLRDVRLAGFATTFDGAAWVVTTGRELLVLDTLREDLRAVWHVADLPGDVGALHRDARAIRFVTSGEDAVEVWRYELPGPVLRNRDRREVRPPGEPLLALAPAGDRWIAAGRTDGGARLRPAWGPSSSPHLVAGARELLAVAGGSAFAAAFSTDGSVEVVAVEPAGLKVRAAVTLGGASSAQVRLDGVRLTVCDGLGRLAGIDLETRRVTHLVCV